MSSRRDTVCSLAHPVDRFCTMAMHGVIRLRPDTGNSIPNVS